MRRSSIRGGSPPRAGALPRWSRPACATPAPSPRRSVPWRWCRATASPSTSTATRITLAVGDQIASKVIDVSTGKPLKSLVSNEGKIRANGGRVELTAAAARTVVDSVINTSGVITANSIGRRNGMIVLSAATGASKPAGAPAQTVKISGTLSAAGKKKGTGGGTILVTGENIKLASARIDASGRAGGGKVLIGGDWRGGNPNKSL